MPADAIECPHCRTRVVAMADGSCPACRKNTQDELGSVLERSTGATREDAFETYTQSIRSTFEQAIGPFRQVEQKFMELRTRAVDRLNANASADRTTADQIEQELLPQFAEAIEQLQQKGEPDAPNVHDTSRLIKYGKTREESWQLLASAIRENDSEKLQQHMELWKASEVLKVWMAGKQSMVESTPAQCLRDFQCALAAFTPRLIATPTIMIVNILVLAAMIATGVDFFAPTVQGVVEWGANFGPRSMSGQWWRLVTSMFLHFGILHLGLNMWVLWDIGRLVERLVGNFGFVVLYFLSGIAGSIASLAWNPLVVSAGASGAVFGVVGALLGLIAFRHDAVPAPVLKQLRNSIAAFLIYNVFYGMTASGIDMAAHIGGLAAGFVSGLILHQPLSVKMIAHRRFRNGTLLVAGAIALPVAAFALPDAPVDIHQEMQHFAEIEKQVIGIHNTLVRQSQLGAISNRVFAETLDREVLLPWIEIRKKIEGLLDLPYADRAHLSRVVNYVKCREESWQLQVEGLLGQDFNKLQQANDKWTAAEEMAKLGL